MKILKKALTAIVSTAIICTSLSFLTGCSDNDSDYNLRTAIMCNNGDGNIDLAKQLIGNGENINKLPSAPFMEENHSLSFAYKDSHSRQDMVYYLISEGADVNYCSTTSKSPLITLSAYNADYELTSLLIEKGADVNLYGNGSSALTYSVSNSMSDEYKQIEVFKLLLENGAEFSDETMQEAVKSGTKDGKMLLLQTVADTAREKGCPTGLPLITEYAVFGDSQGVLNNFSEFEKLAEDERKLCIYACAAFCNPDVMQKLNEAGVDFTEEYFYSGGYIYLHACAYGNMESLKYIYENGLYPDDAFTEQDNNRELGYFYPDTLKYLVDKGMYVDYSPVMTAMTRLDNEMLSFYFSEGLVTPDEYMLLIQHLDELCPDPFNENADDRWLDTVRLVLDNGEGDFIKNVDFAPNLEYCKILVEEYNKPTYCECNTDLATQSVYALSYSYQSPECLEYLISMGANVNECGINNDTVLSLAAEYGFYDSCKILLENGADPNLTYSENGYPAFNWCLTDDYFIGGSDRLFELFMQYDIDFESKIYNGMTAYEFAENYGSQKRADAIKKY
ncbi:MAG: hypothetical protein E7497_04230 [Ruminococcus sp.]|nr:hypothetical protein [Ruminococcus sp.]